MDETLKLKAEQSSVAEQKSSVAYANGGVISQDPVIRQTSFQGTSLLTLGKPRIIGSADIADSTRRLEFEVLMEPVQ